MLISTLIMYVLVLVCMYYCKPIGRWCERPINPITLLLVLLMLYQLRLLFLNRLPNFGKSGLKIEIQSEESTISEKLLFYVKWNYFFPVPFNF